MTRALSDEQHDQRRDHPDADLPASPHGGRYPSRNRWRNSSSKAACRSPGELTVAGNKNAALPILAACLLTEEEVLLHRVPRIRDTEAQIALLERLGVEVAWVADNSVRLCARDVTDVAVDEELSSKIRASFLLAGPLLARFGEARMPPPGGDFIGRRRLDAHLDAFKDLGARVDGDRWIELTAPPAGSAPARSSWTSPR